MDKLNIDLLLNRTILVETDSFRIADMAKFKAALSDQPDYLIDSYALGVMTTLMSIKNRRN